MTLRNVLSIEKSDFSTKYLCLNRKLCSYAEDAAAGREEFNKLVQMICSL